VLACLSFVVKRPHQQQLQEIWLWKTCASLIAWLVLSNVTPAAGCHMRRVV
jgi:hypothetical protein